MDTWQRAGSHRCVRHALPNADASERDADPVVDSFRSHTPGLSLM
jgi:hypothetical protein